MGVIKMNSLVRGQSVVEYMVLFAIIAVLTLLSLCKFYSPIKEGCEGKVQEAIEEILG
jgi:hypothetical protein